MSTLQERIDKALKIVDRTGQKPRGYYDGNPDATELSVDVVTIGEVLKGHWDVEINDAGEYSVIDLLHPTRTN